MITWHPEISAWNDVDFDWDSGFKRVNHFSINIFIALMKAALERYSVKRGLYGPATTVFYHGSDLNIDNLMHMWNMPNSAYDRVNSVRYICYHIDRLISDQVQYKYIDISNISEWGRSTINYFTLDKLAQSIGYDSWNNLPQIGDYDAYLDNPKFLYPISYNDKKISEWVTSRYKILNKMKYVYWLFERGPVKSKQKNVSSTLSWEDAQSKFNLKEWTEYTFQYQAAFSYYRMVSDSIPTEEYATISVQNAFEIRMIKPSIDNMDIADYIDIPTSNLDIYALPYNQWTSSTEDSFCPIGRIVKWNKHNLLASIDIDKNDYNQDGECYINFDTYTDSELASIPKPSANPGESKYCTVDNAICAVEKFDGPNGFKFLAS